MNCYRLFINTKGYFRLQAESNSHVKLVWNMNNQALKNKLFNMLYGKPLNLRE